MKLSQIEIGTERKGRLPVKTNGQAGISDGKRAKQGLRLFHFRHGLYVKARRSNGTGHGKYNLRQKGKPKASMKLQRRLTPL